MYFLNKFGKTITEVNIEHMGAAEIQEALQANGIHTWSPKPTFEPPVITPTEVCRGWRQTGGCDPSGAREAMADEECTKPIANGRSGYCECIGRANAEFGCEHLEITCEEVCKEPEETPEAVDSTINEFEEEF